MLRWLAVRVGFLAVGLTVSIAGCSGGGSQSNGSGGSAGGAPGGGGTSGGGGLGTGGGVPGTGGATVGTGGRGGTGGVGGAQGPRTAAECAYTTAGNAGGNNITIMVDGVTVRFDRNASGSIREAGLDGVDALRIYSSAYILASGSYITMEIHVPRGTTSGAVACGPPLGSGFDTAQPLLVAYIDHCGGYYSTNTRPESCTGTFATIPEHPAGGRLVGTFTATVGKTGSGPGPDMITFTGTVDIPITPL